MNSNNDSNKTFIANFGVAYMNPFFFPLDLSRSIFHVNMNHEQIKFIW